MSVESARSVMMRHVNSDHGDVSSMADDVIIMIMATGREHRRHKPVQGMLNDLLR